MLISVEEYSSMSYRPDCDFVDGEVIERNFGTKDHSKLQGRIYAQNMRILESHEEPHSHRFSIPCSGCHTGRNFSGKSAGAGGSLFRHGSPRSVFDARREV
jgi:hypothetical protein